jgi:hypothetical protein
LDLTRKLNCWHRLRDLLASGKTTVENDSRQSRKIASLLRDKHLAVRTVTDVLIDFIALGYGYGFS